MIHIGSTEQVKLILNLKKSLSICLTFSNSKDKYFKG